MLAYGCHKTTPANRQNPPMPPPDQPYGLFRVADQLGINVGSSVHVKFQAPPQLPYCPMAIRRLSDTNLGHFTRRDNLNVHGLWDNGPTARAHLFEVKYDAIYSFLVDDNVQST